MSIATDTLAAVLALLLPCAIGLDHGVVQEQPLKLGKAGPADLSLTEYLKSKGVVTDTVLKKEERDLVLDYLKEEIESWVDPEPADAWKVHERSLERAWQEGKSRGRNIYSANLRDAYWARRMDAAKHRAFRQGRYHVVRDGGGVDLWARLACEQEECSHIFVYLETFRFGRWHPFEVILMVGYEDRSSSGGKACCPCRKGFVDPTRHADSGKVSRYPPLAQYSSLWFMPNLPSTCGRRLDEHAAVHAVSVTSVYCKLLINRMGTRVAGPRRVISGDSINLASADPYEVGQPLGYSVQDGPKRDLLGTSYKWTQRLQDGRVPMVVHLYRPASLAAQAGPTRMSEDTILDKSTKIDKDTEIVSSRFERARDWVFWSAPLQPEPAKVK